MLWWISPSFPSNIPFLLGFNAVCLAASALGLFFLLRRRFLWSAPAAAFVSTMVHVSVPTLTLASVLLSEALFLALLWPTLLLAERALDGEDSPTAAVLSAGAFAGVLMSCRTLGLAAVLALPLALCTKRRGRDAALALGASIVVMLPWTLWTWIATPRVPAPLQGAYGTYASFFSGGARAGGVWLFAHVAALNARELALSVADRVVPGLPVKLARPALTVLAACFVLGCWRLTTRNRVTVAFIGTYACIILATAFTPWRYLWAVWPLCVAIAAEGARSAVSGVRPRPLQAAVATLLALPALGMATTEWRSLASGAWREPVDNATRQIAPLVRWVQGNTAPSDVVLAEGAEVVTLFTGRLAAPPVEFAALDYVAAQSVVRTATSLSAMVEAVPATNLVTISPLTIAAARSMGARRPALAESAMFGGGVAFRIVR